MQKPEGLFAFANLAILGAPSIVGINRAWLDTKELTLWECGELIAQRKTVERRVGLKHQTGFSDGFF
jgi:hypothetical protein